MAYLVGLPAFILVRRLDDDSPFVPLVRWGRLPRDYWDAVQLAVNELDGPYHIEVLADTAELHARERLVLTRDHERVYQRLAGEPLDTPSGDAWWHEMHGVKKVIEDNLQAAADTEFDAAPLPAIKLAEEPKSKELFKSGDESVGRWLLPPLLPLAEIARCYGADYRTVLPILAETGLIQKSDRLWTVRLDNINPSLADSIEATAKPSPKRKGKPK